MTVNLCRSFLFLLLFIESVLSIQNTFQSSSSPPICSYPYSCIPTSECAERHAARGTDEVLFHCEGRRKVCCPPINSPFPPVSSAQGIPNIYTTTERSESSGCAKCAFEINRPQSAGEHSVKKETNTHTPQGNNQNPGHHVHEAGNNKYKPNQPTETRRPVQPQPTDTRRPIQPQPTDTRRPVQPQPTETRRPIQPQPVEGRRPPQPLNSQSSPQPVRPISLMPVPEPTESRLTTHRNFRLLPSESHCGVNSFANRITEGEEVSLGEYPWMVLTGLRDKYGNYRWNCGGTLINGWYVLTAAHCLVVDNRTIEYVRLGEHSLTNETDCYRDVCLEPAEDIAIAEAIPHEKWNTTTIKNDIALLRLSRNPLKLGKSNIFPICLPLDTEKLNITSSTKYEVAGWGKTDWNADEGSDVLRKAFISGVNREECNICKDKKKQQYCPITDTQLCVQGWKSVDVCKGDSGGPLMVTRLNIYQIGITSFKGSEYCGAENIPSIFTKVESYLPWILDNIRE